MLPLQAGRDYQALLVDADICFITQQAGAGNSFFPSKLLGLLAESKPVVTVAAPECELALSLMRGKFWRKHRRPVSRRNWLRCSIRSRTIRSG